MRRSAPGGMSTVYRAFDTVLERQVAIKLMHRNIAEDSDQLERFRREARAVAQLNHPHIVDSHRRGRGRGGAPYIVFEYVEGETLKDRIRRHGRLPVAESVAYAIEVARALGAAHARGIVHRDVKPQNVLIDEEGSAKVTDFGIARTLDQDGLTADGRVLGTTDYVSPEQALGHAVTGQSDLYSLGIVLFEMLTGDVPFHGENQVAVAMKHVREELPDVQVRRPEVSSALASVVDRATAKDLEPPLRRPRRADRRPRGRARDRDRPRAARRPARRPPSSARCPSAKRRRAPAAPAAPGAAVRRCSRSWPSPPSRRCCCLGRTSTERGTGPSRGAQAAAPAHPVSLAQTRPTTTTRSATRHEHPDQARPSSTATRARPGRPRPTTAATSAKAGVGIYVDAAPGVAATRMEIRTPHARLPGDDLRRASRRPPATLPTRAGPSRRRRLGGEATRVALDGTRTATSSSGSRSCRPARERIDRDRSTSASS